MPPDEATRRRLIDESVFAQVDRATLDYRPRCYRIDPSESDQRKFVRETFNSSKKKEEKNPLFLKGRNCIDPAKAGSTTKSMRERARVFYGQRLLGK